MVSRRTRSIEADLFLTASLREPSSPSVNPPRNAPLTTDAATVASSPRYLLLKDLASGIRQLTDQEFDRLLAAVLAEQKRRGKKLPVSRKTSRKSYIKEIRPPLTLAKLNAVRAAFKAGIAPSRIEISHADIRKALQAVRRSGHPIGTRRHRGSYTAGGPNRPYPPYALPPTGKDCRRAERAERLALAGGITRRYGMC
jgi:hypothetical protein